jgi:hypothetical protein
LLPISRSKTAHQHGIQPAARGNPAERRGIEGQQKVTDNRNPQQIDDGKETPSLPPANIVPVKKVKLNRTMEMENTPLRPAAGASTSGKSLLFDIVEPLVAIRMAMAEG